MRRKTTKRGVYENEALANKRPFVNVTNKVRIKIGLSKQMKICIIKIIKIIETIWICIGRAGVIPLNETGVYWEHAQHSLNYRKTKTWRWRKSQYEKLFERKDVKNGSGSTFQNRVQCIMRAVALLKGNDFLQPLLIRRMKVRRPKSMSESNTAKSSWNDCMQTEKKKKNNNNRSLNCHVVSDICHLIFCLQSGTGALFTEQLW